MAGLSQEEKQRRLDVLRRGVDAVCQAIEMVGAEYGDRFRKNGGPDAILHEAKERLAKPGRKPKSEATA